MSSDYGDFCHEQRELRKQKRDGLWRLNTAALEANLKDSPIVPRWLDDNCARLTLGKVVVDYWPSTGTARVIHCEGRTGDTRRHLGARTVVRWVTTLHAERTGATP